ncbi:Asparagine synthetase [glutamine-hydrolyzing] 1 [Candidatus Methylomirabilis lanthanidiphila]|uniref:asparagine synthase (glutamine-hydrolyzing) n=1 Tax=Candidatus Methylomirabilis lanthanidiphila TaxID=2211376 RepID=A0A564ZHJ7_9BACT|nr:Asparagine synthetase [glutamine-hydrolyzing] 1 [Candidatus Methylomirabilis lanthanidiphila]
MLDPETGNAIVFNGEIYNFQALRKECEAVGDSFRSNSDTEVIVALYRRHGVACVNKLRGMFAFVIWDDANKRVFLARDRVGKKPLNYAIVNGGIIFCSEIDPLSRHPAVSREMDLEGLELYLQLQYIPAPWTIYKSIRKLPPAHYAIFDRNGFKTECYWDVDYTKKIAISEQDALDGLEEKLTEAVRLRMIADVPLGALLSGGVDSSVVVALMAKLSGEPIRTYSIGFREEAFNELPFAEQAAKICGTAHHSEIVEGDVTHLVPALARHYGEPFADHSAVPSFFVCRTARRHVTVAMNGDGGDELLGGYPRYYLSPLQIRMGSVVPDILSASALTVLATRLSTVTSIPERAIRKMVIEYGWPELRAVPIKNEFWNDCERTIILGKHASRTLLSCWRSTYFAKAVEQAANPVDRMLWYDNHTYLSGCLLPKMDIASMHCGLETRSPLLDHKVIEYCAALPVEFKVKNRVGKYLLKKLAERYFPASFVHRRKMGFGIPLGEWLRGPLRPALDATLRNPKLMAPLDWPLIETILNEFFRTQIDHSKRLWALYMYGAWRQHCLNDDIDYKE